MILGGILMRKTFYFHPDQEFALCDFSNQLFHFIQKTKKDSQTIVLVCIGTDRATGDCLGPLVGHFLKQQMPSKIPFIFGNLSHPVHAANLAQTLAYIKTSIFSPYIIVIDACLGSPGHVGYVTLSNQALHPGKGVHKKLPSLGQISITGIVDCFGEENYSIIQSTRLHQVVRLATFIANGIQKIF